MPMPCGTRITLPGWYCTRDAGHDGPCAAISTEDMITRFGSVILRLENQVWIAYCIGLGSGMLLQWIGHALHMAR